MPLTGTGCPIAAHQREVLTTLSVTKLETVCHLLDTPSNVDTQVAIKNPTSSSLRE